MLCLGKYDCGHICRGWMRLVFQQLEMSKRAHHPRHCALPGHQVGVQTGTSLTPAFQHIITAGALRQREAHTFLNNLCIRLITLEGGQVESSQQSNKYSVQTIQCNTIPVTRNFQFTQQVAWHGTANQNIFDIYSAYTCLGCCLTVKGYRGDRTRANYWWQQQQ